MRLSTLTEERFRAEILARAAELGYPMVFTSMGSANNNRDSWESCVRTTTRAGLDALNHELDLAAERADKAARFEDDWQADRQRHQRYADSVERVAAQRLLRFR